MKPNVELYIDELVLHGFPPGDHHRIGDAVERELIRLFAEQGISPSLGQDSEVARLDSGAFEAKPGLGTEAIGIQVAQTVHWGLSG